MKIPSSVVEHGTYKGTHHEDHAPHRARAPADAASFSPSLRLVPEGRGTRHEPARRGRHQRDSIPPDSPGTLTRAAGLSRRKTPRSCRCGAPPIMRCRWFSSGGGSLEVGDNAATCVSVDERAAPIDIGATRPNAGHGNYGTRPEPACFKLPASSLLLGRRDGREHARVMPKPP